MNLPKVELYIDGNKFISNQEDRHSNPEIIDDWPLHAAQGINTTLTLGACYQSSENRLKHGFRGDISSIKLNLNTVLTEDDIKCGTNCAERLLTPDEKLMGLNQQIQINTQMNEVTVEGGDRQNIEQLMQKIQYVNYKANPTIGRRNINVVATVSCPMKKAIRLPTIDTFIMISDSGQTSSNMSQTTSDMDLDELKPQITISGNQNNLVSYPDIKSGVKFLEAINIVIYSNDQVQENLQKLDSCNVNGEKKSKIFIKLSYLTLFSFLQFSQT